MIELRPHQIEISNTILKRPRCLIVSDVGSGKTLATLHALERLGARKILVVAPLLVCKYTWPKECERMGFTHAFKQPGARVTLVNFESVHKLEETDFDVVVIDESSKLKGFQFRGGTKRSKLIYEICRKATRVVLLTGTPCSESLGDLYSQVAFLDHGSHFGRSKMQFMARYHFDLSRSPCDKYARRILERTRL